MQTAIGTTTRCPGCCSPASPGEAHCGGCGLWLAGPQVAEIRWIDGELRKVDEARTWLTSRRAVLLDQLIANRRRSAGPMAFVAGSAAGAAAAAVAAAAVADRARAARPEVPAATADRPAEAPARRPGRPPEVSVRTVARLLLAAGAALVVIAVLIFAVAGWTRLGPAGRFGILLAATALVLAAPRALAGRGLYATAESVAAIGLALTIVDAALALRLIPSHPGGPLAYAGATTVLAVTWRAYGVVGKLRGPRLAAIVLAQLPGPLALTGLVRQIGGPGSPVAGPLAVALVLDSVACLALARREGLDRIEAAVATVTAASAWVCGVLAAATGLAVAAGRPDVPWLAAALVAAAAIGIAGPTGTQLARPAAAISGALLAVGLALPVAAVLPPAWELAVIAGSSVLVGAIALSRGASATTGSPDAGSPAPDLVAAGASATLAVTALIAVPVAVVGLFPAHLLPVWSGSVLRAGSGAVAAATVLALAALGCLLAPVPPRVRGPARAAGLVAGALAGGSLWLPGWAGLAVPTATTAILLTVGAMLADQTQGHQTQGHQAQGDGRPGDRTLGGVAAAAGTVVAASAALRSLTAPEVTIAELAVLTVCFCLAAALARQAFRAAVSTAGALAAATGLACAVPLASGWPARYAEFAALGVAIAAVGVATRLRTAAPVQSAVLDIGAVPVAVLCAVLTAQRQDAFALLAVTAALAASITAWLRTGVRQLIALVAAVCAALAALAAQGQPLVRALLAPDRMIARAWQGHELAYAGSGRSPGLQLAVVVLAVCLASLVIAAGAWRGTGLASLDAVALALPLVAAPAAVAGTAGLAAGAGYWLTVAALLTLSLALTAWAALGQSLAPAGAALVAAALTVSWALAAPLPTLIVLGCLTVAYSLAAWRSVLPETRIAATCLSVLAAAALAGCAVLAGHGTAWQAGLAVLGVGAAAQAAAAVLARERRGQRDGESPAAARGALASLAAEITGWLVAAIGVGLGAAKPETGSLALAVSGLICLGVAARRDRHRAIWVALGLFEAAWCCWLLAAGVVAAEPYTAPAAAIVLGLGWARSRREPVPHSWVALGPGLLFLLLPSLIMSWLSPGWIRPLLLGILATAIALAGARARKQAPLVIGIGVAVLDAGRELARAFLLLIHAVPGWIPIAVLGAAMLWAGATYESRLRNLRAIRGSLAAMS